jgi:hypothetical protein
VTTCVRPACGVELPSVARYCHTCGVPQLAPCPLCGFGGDDGLGIPLRTNQCPRCRSFLRHCPSCLKPFPLSSTHCDNVSWGCAGSALIGGSQAFACVGASVTRSYSIVEAVERRPRERTAEFARAWRMELTEQRSLSDAVVAHGRLYALNLRSQRLLSVPIRFDDDPGTVRQRFGFDDTHASVDRSEELPLLRTPSIRDLSVRGGHVSFLVVPKPIALHDGRIEQAPEAIAFLLDAATLGVVRQTRRDRIRYVHLGEASWLLVTEPAGAPGLRITLLSLRDGSVVAESDVRATFEAGIPPVEAAGKAYLATSDGVLEVDLADGRQRMVRVAAGPTHVRGLLALDGVVVVHVAGDRIGHHRFGLVDAGSGVMVEAASVSIAVDGPIAGLDGTLYLLDDNAKTLRAFSLGGQQAFASPDLNVRLRDLGDTRDLLLMRSGASLFLARKVQTDQGFTSFQVEQIRPHDRGIIGFHRLRSPDTSFAYADGRLFVVDKYHGTIEALEVFPS